MYNKKRKKEKTMSLLLTLRKDKMNALKEKDTVKNGVCSLLISAIALAEKEQNKELSEEEAAAYIQKELKQTKETLSLTPKDRTDLIEETKRKIEILESYLPKQMSQEEIKEAVEAILAEKNLEAIKKNQGILIKEMMAKYKGKTDGKTVSTVIQTILK